MVLAQRIERLLSILGLVLKLAMLFLQSRNNGGISHGGSVSEFRVASRDFPQDPSHDFSGPGLR